MEWFHTEFETQGRYSYILGDAEKFHERLYHYEDSALRMLYEYYRDDLIYIVESLNTRSFLSELKLVTKLKLERYLSLKEDLGDFVFAETLVQDILEAGREAVIGFWKCLYALVADHPHPNLLSMLDEILHGGDTLVEKILLDKYGHNLTPELKDIQEKHKEHLLEKAQYLVEHRPPRSKQEKQSFYITERYVNMIAVSDDHFRQRAQHELIETGRNHEDIMRKEILMVEHIALNKLFRWSRQKQCEPSVVMVSGVPGIGKTTLMQKFVYDWVTGKLYQRFSFVFFFKFRELNRPDKISLETMILQQYPYLQGQLENILQDPDKLLFIFDGLDESNHSIDFRSYHLCSNPQWAECSSVIVVSLVRKSLLKGCSVLITSRPTKLTLTDSGAFQRITEIMGFFPKERQMYFDMFFQNKELSEKAFHYVRENDTLYTFCYIPSYCWIICTVLSMCFKAQPTTTDQLMSSLPKTVTQLFVTFVANILSNHNQDDHGARQLMTSIGWMAEHGVMNHILAFDERDLGSFNVDTSSHLTSSFMIEADQPPNVTFSFLHLTIQEFLAALVHYLDYSPEKLQSSINKAELYTDGRAEIFLRFLCGFLDSSTRSILKCLGEFPIKALKDVTSWLQKSLVNIPNEGNVDMGTFRNILVYLFESQNRALVEECLGSNREFTLSSVSHLTPVDYTALAFVLKSCRETETLNVHHCNIQSEGWERLAPVLHTIKHINLSDTGLNDSYIDFIASALNHHECRIQHLCLSNNGLTDRSCSYLAPAIGNNQSLRKLDLSVNSLEGPYLGQLATALSCPTCRIEELLLNANMLTDKSSSPLASVITNNQSLRILNLSHNNLEGPHFLELVTALSRPTCRIEELLLSYCKLTDSSCSMLTFAIKDNQSLRKLNLSGNNLEGPHFCDLVTALSSPTCRIEELHLWETRLTDEHSLLLLSLSNNTNLTYLDLSRNDFQDRGRNVIIELIQTSTSLKEIRFNNLRWTKEQKEDLMEMERPDLKILQELHSETSHTVTGL